MTSYESSTKSYRSSGKRKRWCETQATRRAQRGRLLNGVQRVGYGTSAPGQRRKGSRGAFVVRFAPDSRPNSRRHGRSAECHVWTAPRWQELSSRLQAWSVQPCVRPFCAVHMTAGHNALRGSGPGQNLAFDNALAQVGCPDRRVDRLCITCCSPSQPSHHAGYPARSRYAASATGSL
jgi:hypothetical protein